MLATGLASQSDSHCRLPNSSTIKKLNFLVDCLISDCIKFTMSANYVTPSSSFTIALLKVHLTIKPRVSLILFPSFTSNLS